MASLMAQPRRGVSVRVRVLIYLTVLTAVALAVAGTTAYVIERSRIDARIETDLALRAAGLSGVAAESDPATGEPYTDAEAVLREEIRRVVATPTEGAVALIDGVPRFIPRGDDVLRPDQDDGLLTAALAAAEEDPQVRAITTDRADYRYVSMPAVDAAGELQGVVVYAVDRGAMVAEVTDTFRVYAMVAALSLVTISGLGYFTVGRLLEPIRLLDSTAQRISTTDLTERIPIVGDDDLARLSHTVNQMLDRIERAFSEQSRMLDDASHELRTPLTILRNRLELLEPRDSDAVVAARDELLDEVSRMARLVDDLVILAKADRPEFLLLAPVDLAALTHVALARAQALDNREWTVDAVAEATVEADGERLVQAWLQLCANAVKFSPDDCRVALGSSIAVDEDGIARVRMWVRDQGVGISPEHIETVLSRFGRVDPTRDGAGLGLPIVSAVAEAHGGELDIRSEPGHGSTFTIIVPAYSPSGAEVRPSSPREPSTSEAVPEESMP